jgi:hypothetical protein
VQVGLGEGFPRGEMMVREVETGGVNRPGGGVVEKTRERKRGKRRQEEKGNRKGRDRKKKSGAPARERA